MNIRKFVQAMLVAAVVSATGVPGLLPAGSAAAACAALPTDKGTATATINVPADGSYRVWNRILAPDTTNNSFYLQIDDTTCGVVVGDAAITANSWTWVDYQGGNSASKINVNLTAGQHTLTMAGRETGVEVDRVELASDTSCVPSGTGDNCATVPDPNAKPDMIVTAISPVAATPGSQVAFAATVKNQGTAATPANTIIGVSFRVDGDLVSWSDSDTTSLAPGASVTLTSNSGPNGTASWTAIDGTHSVEAWVDDIDRFPELDDTGNNKLAVSVVVSSTATTPTPTTAPTATPTPTPTSGATPWGGSPLSIAATGMTKLEAENYDMGGDNVGYHDVSTTGGCNASGASCAYRNDAVSVKDSSAYSNSHAVGYYDTGDWLSYTVTVPTAGTYAFSTHSATNISNGTLGVSVDGSSKGTLTSPNNGDFSTFGDSSALSVALTAGRHVIQLTSNSPAGYFGDLDYVGITKTGTTTPTPTPTPSGTFSPADFDHNSKVDIHDLSALLSAWGGTSGAADITGDHKIDIHDLSALLSAWTG